MTDPRIPLRDAEADAMLRRLEAETATGLSPVEFDRLLAEVRAERARVDPEGVRHRNRWITLILTGTLALAALSCLTSRDELLAGVRKHAEEARRFPPRAATGAEYRPFSLFVPSMGLDLPRGWSVTHQGRTGRFTLVGTGGPGNEEARVREMVAYVKWMGNRIDIAQEPQGSVPVYERWRATYGDRQRVIVRSPQGVREKWYDRSGRAR